MIKPIIITLALILTAAISFAADQPAATAQKAGDAYPLLFSGALTSAKLTALPADTLIKSKDVNISRKDLDAEIAKAPASLKAQLLKNAFFILENMATMKLAILEAQKWADENKKEFDTQDDLIRGYIEGVIGKVSVSDEETKLFFEGNHDTLGGATYDQAKESIRGYLLEQKRMEALDSHIKGLGDRIPVEINKTWVHQQSVISADNPVDKARKSGKPTMVDFGAEGCRPCEMMAPILDSIKKEYEGKLNVVFVHVRKEEILSARFGATVIPVQIFFDKTGKQFFRHNGFFSKEQIQSKLAEMGIK